MAVHLRLAEQYKVTLTDEEGREHDLGQLYYYGSDADDTDVVLRFSALNPIDRLNKRAEVDVRKRR